MKKSLVNSFYEVMHKYEKHFSDVGVKTNLSIWFKKKGALISLLRNHPNWDENALAVISEVAEIREINRDEIDVQCAALVQLTNSCNLDETTKQNFKSALESTTVDYSSTLSDTYIETIKEKGGISCVSGQKTSRIIKKLCLQFGIAASPKYDKDYNRKFNQIFDRLSDALNPITVKKKAILSVNPCDYLEMSSTANTWTSCHRLSNGEYQAGCLSYLTDRDTLMFYTVDNNVVSDYFKASRRTRQVFCYHNGILLQSRLYPSDLNDSVIIKQNRGIVQGIITTCLEAPNKWIKIKAANQSKYYETVTGSLHYKDYTYNGYSIISVLENSQKLYSEYECKKLKIGSRAICVCCGKTLTNRRDTKCSSCEEMVVCKDCGHTVPASKSRYIDNAWFCNVCLHICAGCGQTCNADSIRVFDGHGNKIELCTVCHENFNLNCDTCSVNTICTTLDCNRFCHRVAVAMNMAA